MRMRALHLRLLVVYVYWFSLLLECWLQNRLPVSVGLRCCMYIRILSDGALIRSSGSLWDHQGSSRFTFRIGRLCRELKESTTWKHERGENSFILKGEHMHDMSLVSRFSSHGLDSFPRRSRWYLVPPFFDVRSWVEQITFADLDEPFTIRQMKQVSQRENLALEWGRE